MYFTLDYNQSLTGGEKSWLEEHGDIRMGFLNNDPAIFSMDETTGKLTGMLPEYVSYAKDCLGNQTLKFNIQDYDDYDEMLQALIYDNDQDFKSVPLTNILVLLRKARKAEAVAKCHRELMT